MSDRVTLSDLHEEFAVGRRPAPVLVEEPRLVGPDAVAACVMWATQTPRGLAHLVGTGLESSQHEPVIALPNEEV